MDKIVIITKTLSCGGAEKNCINLANFLSKYYLVEIIVLSGNNNVFSNILNNDVQIKYLNLKKRCVVFFKLLKYRDLKKSKCLIIFDPLISCFFNIYKLIGFYKHLKIISRCVNTLSEQAKSSNKFLIKKDIRNFFYKVFYKLSNVIVAQSLGMKDDLVLNYRIPENKIAIINNSLDFDNIKSLMKESILGEEKYFENPTITIVGRLVKQKNHIFLIEIIKRLLLRNKKINLLIIGDGLYKNTLLTKVKEYGLENNVFILGVKKNPYKYIYNADFLWLPSLYEGFPNVLLDAIACSTVIIANDCKSGPKEIISQNSKFEQKMNYFEVYKYGYLYSMTNLEEISDKFIDEVEKIIYSAKELNEKISISYKDLHYKYSFKTQLNKYISLIEESYEK